MYGMKYTDEMKQFILDNYKGRYNQELADLFNQKFNTNITSRTIKSYKANNKLNSGLTGKFRKGQTPHNKGKKMPKEVYEKVKHTMFANGNVPPNHRPVGSERISKDGYIEVKVAEPNKWRLKQRVVYEEAKGKIPEGCTIIFLDGNKQNCNIDNLRCITRSELLYLNCNGLNNSNEITETGILMARLDRAKNKKKQELKDKNVKKC
jgi:phage protein